MAILPAVDRLLRTRRGRLLLENLTAYLFLTPASLLILLFGLFPVAFAFFVSLHRWRRFPDEYVGLANYEKALGNLGYILFFWLALIGFAAAAMFGKRLLNAFRQSTGQNGIAALLAGVVSGYAALLAIDWLFKLIPVIMLIPRLVRGQNTSLTLFMEKLGESFTTPHVYAAGKPDVGRTSASRRHHRACGLALSFQRQPAAYRIERQHDGLSGRGMFSPAIDCVGDRVGDCRSA